MYKLFGQVPAREGPISQSACWSVSKRSLQKAPARKKKRIKEDESGEQGENRMGKLS